MQELIAELIEATRAHHLAVREERNQEGLYREAEARRQEAEQRMRQARAAFYHQIDAAAGVPPDFLAF